MAGSPSFAALSRQKGKRERTRAALIDATADLIAKRGPEDIAISDITEAAAVANGTFYNHFNSKAEIIAETAFCIVEQIGAQIHQAGLAAGDPVERVASGDRRFVEFAVSHPPWAWALLRSVDYLPSVRANIYRYITATVHLGAAGGKFTATVDEFTFDVLISMLFAAVRARLTGVVGPEAGSRVAEMHLRVLGVAAEAARAAAYRDLASLEFSFGEIGAGGFKILRPGPIET